MEKNIVGCWVGNENGPNGMHSSAGICRQREGGERKDAAFASYRSSDSERGLLLLLLRSPRIRSFVLLRLALHFTSKWIILSEIKFHSKPAEAEQMNHLTVDEEPKLNVFQNEDNLVRDSKVVEESLNSSENEDPEPRESS